MASGKVLIRIKSLSWSNYFDKRNDDRVVTNVDGVFFILVPDTPARVELVFSFVGMKSKTIAYKDRPKKGDWVITMEEDLLEMDEVVVTGYQNLKKSQVAGSVSVIDAAKVRLGGVPSIENMLQGRYWYELIINSEIRLQPSSNSWYVVYFG
ncbi:MAG: hypothetical protein ACLU4J_13960 [Butyricimonas paravirosa]